MSGPGIRAPIYLGGVNLSRGPQRIDPKPSYAETRQRLRTGDLMVDRGAPYTGYNERVSKWSWALSFDSLPTADLKTMADVLAYGGPFDFCPWLWLSESWWFASGESFSGTLQRRRAITEVPSGSRPAGYAVDYATEILKDGADFSGSVTIGSVDSSYRTPWTATGTATGNRVVFRYVPLYRVYVGEDQPLIQQPHSQGWTLTLEEA